MQVWIKKEASVENRVCKYAKEKGCQVFKLTFLGYRGAPDRLFLASNGVLFFIEFKRKGKDANPQQQYVHRMLRKYGQRVYVIDSVEEGVRVIDNEITSVSKAYRKPARR